MMDAITRSEIAQRIERLTADEIHRRADLMLKDGVFVPGQPIKSDHIMQVIASLVREMD